MTREEAAQALARMRAGIEDTLAYEQHSAKGYQNLYESREALQMGAEALMPWVRTADRVPDIKTSGFWLLAADENSEIDMVDAAMVVQGGYPWWMPIPPLPDHIADAGKKVGDEQ